MTALKALRPRCAFDRDPVGTYVCGRTYVVWCAAPDLVGTVQWGVPDDRDIHELFALIDFDRHPVLAPRLTVLVDARAIERIDPDGMLRFLALVRERWPRWAPRIGRQTVIVPDGVRGLLLAGALPLLAPAYPFELVASSEAAMPFVDHPRAAAAHAQMTEVASAAQTAGRLSSRLRAVLAGDLAKASVAAAADALRMSPRSLQRALRAGGTSFSAELRKARVAVAVEYLKFDRDLKTEIVAQRVGFGSSSRLAAALRREVGVTASALRSAGR